jgi:uridine phosphorylase
MPYCCKCSESLKEKIAWDMQTGNTLSAPGFYAPQGREIRIKPRNPSFLNELVYFHHNDFWLSNFEMEASAYYGLGKMLGHEVLCLSAIIANRAKKTFSRQYNVIIDKLIQKVIERI